MLGYLLSLLESQRIKYVGEEIVIFYLKMLRITRTSSSNSNFRQKEGTEAARQSADNHGNRSGT